MICIMEVGLQSSITDDTHLAVIMVTFLYVTFHGYLICKTNL